MQGAIHNMERKDKIVRTLLNQAKQRPVFKIPVIVIITCIMWFYYLTNGIRRNKGRCCILLSAAVLFFFCTSFSLRAQGQMKAAAAVDPLGEGIQKQIIQTDTKLEQNDTTIVANIPLYASAPQISDYIETDGEPADEEDIDAFIKNTREQTERELEGGGQTENGQSNTEAGEVVIYDEKGRQIEADFEEDWKLILVNKQNPVPEDYEMELVSVNGSMQVDKRIAKPLAEMLDAAQKDGVSLMICSAYRSFDRQTILFEIKIRRLMNSGMTYLEAYAESSYSVTVPGTSEHELGLALDIVSPSYTSLNEGFQDTEAGEWLRTHASEYGFILRYPKGKEYITGITYEPWHFRYVGEQAAQEIKKSGLSLEEYLKQIGMK
ncbi:MAG: M15 family metallopeptidase [Lachnospiraceae bacterium]